jgi:hypothetical protein
MDDAFFCFTLERLTVEIQPGTYTVEVTYSPHFLRPLPLIGGVKGRTAVRIHPGCTIFDTDGCILVGNHSNGTTLTDSRAASDSLNERITAAIGRGESIRMEILDAA